MVEERGTPTSARRAAAIATIALAVAVLVLTVASATDDLARAAVTIPLVLVAIAAAWYGLTRAGPRRTIALVVCAAAVVGVLASGFIAGLWPAVWSGVRLALIVVVVVLARFALARDVRSLKAAPIAGEPVPAARNGVLLVNPRSGDGKAERVGLVDAARERGIRTIELDGNADLRALADGAIVDGADVLGMAGGDGSQALVASVAAEHDVPVVVVPSGTRNHLAMDLGLDRDDVVGALDAFGPAVERRIDLGDVNGQVFVNNVSLGLYAEIVRSPEYRDAKVDTTIATLQDALAPDTPAYDLRFNDGEGRRHDHAHVIQVSNGAYGDTLGGMASRPALDRHELQIITLEVTDDRAAASLVAALAAHRPERHEGFDTWTAPSFEVVSDDPVAVGLDGEATTIDAPLRFSLRDGGVRVRLPPHAIGYSPARLSLHLRTAVRDLVAVAAGRPASIEEG